VPLSYSDSAQQIDISKACTQKIAWQPMGATAWDIRPNFEGAIDIRTGAIPHGYVQIFRGGAVESIKTNILVETSGVKRLNQYAIEGWTLSALNLYLPALRDLGVLPPLVVMPTLMNVQNAWLGDSLYVKDGESPVAFEREILPLPPITIDEFGTLERYSTLLKSAFDALWNAAGYISQREKDETGTMR
jgi:hypothetical protein